LLLLLIIHWLTTRWRIIPRWRCPIPIGILLIICPRIARRRRCSISRLTISICWWRRILIASTTSLRSTYRLSIYHLLLLFRRIFVVEC
jgi:hypothetical protein